MSYGSAEATDRLVSDICSGDVLLPSHLLPTLAGSDKLLSDPALQLLFLVPPPVKVPPPRALKVTEISGNSLRLQWEAVAASDVVVYQIKWSTASGEKPQEV